MRIEFAAVTRFDQVEIAAYAMETIAAVAGVCMLEDLQIDKDLLLQQIISNPEAFQLDGEEDFLEEEDFGGRQLAEEKFTIALIDFLARRRDRLGSSYPFELESEDGLTLTRKPQENLGAISLGVFCLTLFLLLQDTEVVQILDAERNEYAGRFEKLFEIISAYAISADTEGVVWWTGKARDRKSFLRQLGRVASKANYGTVKEEAQLEPNQIGVNDGGVDALGITTRRGIVEADSQCFLVGATYQRTARRNKIVGDRDLDRLRGFFLHVPNVTFQGVLAIPFKATLAEANNCRDQNCRYFPLEIIEAKLGLTASQLVPLGIRHYRKLLDKQMKIKTVPAIEKLVVDVGGRVSSIPAF